MIKNKAHKKLNSTKSTDPYGENLSFSIWLLDKIEDKEISRNNDLDFLTYEYYLYQQQIDRGTGIDEQEFNGNKELYKKYNTELKARFNECLKFYKYFKLNNNKKITKQVDLIDYVSKTLSVVCNDFSQDSNFEEDEHYLTSKDAVEIKVAQGALMSCLFKNAYSSSKKLTVQDLFIAKLIWAEKQKEGRHSMRDCINDAARLSDDEKQQYIKEYLGSYLDFLSFCKIYDLCKHSKKGESSLEIDIKNSNLDFAGYSKDGINVLLKIKDKDKLKKGTNIDSLIEVAETLLTQNMYQKFNGEKEDLDKLLWEKYPEFAGIHTKTITEALPMLLLEHYLGVPAIEHYKHTVIAENVKVSENDKRKLKMMPVNNDYLLINTRYDQQNKIRSTAQGLQSDGLYFKYNPNTGKYIAFISEPAAYEKLVDFLKSEIWNRSNSDHLLFNLFPMGLNNIERFHVISSGPIDKAEDKQKIIEAIKDQYYTTANFPNIHLSIDFVSNKDMNKIMSIIASKNFDETQKYLDSCELFETNNYESYLEWKENKKNWEKIHKSSMAQKKLFFHKLFELCEENIEVYQQIAPLFDFYDNKNAKREELYDGCYGDGEFRVSREQLGITSETEYHNYDLNNSKLKKFVKNKIDEAEEENKTSRARRTMKK